MWTSTILLIALGFTLSSARAHQSRRYHSRPIPHSRTSPSDWGTSGKIEFFQHGRPTLNRDITFADAPRTKYGVENVTREQRDFEVGGRRSPEYISMRESMTHKGSTNHLSRDSVVVLDNSNNPQTLGSQIEGSFSPDDKPGTFTAFVNGKLESVNTPEGLQLVPKENPNSSNSIGFNIVPDKSKPRENYPGTLLTAPGSKVLNVRCDFAEGKSYGTITVQTQNGNIKGIEIHQVELLKIDGAVTVRAYKVKPDIKSPPSFIQAAAKPTHTPPVDMPVATPAAAH